MLPLDVRGALKTGRGTRVAAATPTCPGVNDVRDAAVTSAWKYEESTSANDALSGVLVSQSAASTVPLHVETRYAWRSLITSRGILQVLHRESKKGCHHNHGYITLSVLDRFAKFFHCCEEQ